jgi:hypothetical protein
VDEALTTTEAAMQLGFRLGKGEAITTSEAAEITGLNYHSAYKMLARGSRAVPICQEPGGRRRWLARTEYTRRRIPAHLIETRAMVDDIERAFLSASTLDAPRVNWLIQHFRYQLDVIEAMESERKP